jgi:hypothetical protein
VAPQLARATATEPKWGRGIEGQRKADLGNGTYLNPILSGDHPDPTILKDGDDYYMTFSSFLSYPGVIIWHSRDLVNWAPIGSALSKPIGSVWAMDLIKHNGRYFIYIPATPNGKGTIFVIWADNINGPWSDPDRSAHRCHRSWPRGRRGWQALPVRQRRAPHRPDRRRPGDRGHAGKSLRTVALPIRLGGGNVRARRTEDSCAAMAGSTWCWRSVAPPARRPATW